MHNYCRLCNLILKQKFHNNIWELLNKKFSVRVIEQFAGLSSCADVPKQLNQDMGRCKQSMISFSQGLCSVYSRQSVEFGKNFSTSSTVLSSKQMSEQDKEKFRNYRLITVIILSLLFVVYMSFTVQYHQDYVHIEPSDDKR